MDRLNQNIINETSAFEQGYLAVFDSCPSALSCIISPIKTAGLYLLVKPLDYFVRKIMDIAQKIMSCFTGSQKESKSAATQIEERVSALMAKLEEANKKVDPNEPVIDPDLISSGIDKMRDRLKAVIKHHQTLKLQKGQKFHYEMRKIGGTWQLFIGFKSLEERDAFQNAGNHLPHEVITDNAALKRYNPKLQEGSYIEVWQYE